MAKFTGTIRKSDLEGGVYQLVAEDGEIYELEGGDPLLKREGARVEIDGSVDKGAMSFTMTGPRLKAHAVRDLGK
jgi:hypothetical protein